MKTVKCSQILCIKTGAAQLFVMNSLGSELNYPSQSVITVYNLKFLDF